jgi:GNAT superfamily N-acetyltransferase
MFAMNIKKAVTGDLPKLVDFDQIAREGPARIDEIKAAIVRGHCWVYSESGMPYGYAIYQPDFLGRPFINLLYVANDHRRKGVASKLIAHLETLGGQDRMFTSTAQGNAPMCQLLSKLGYQKCGEIHAIDDNDTELVFVRYLG